MQNGSRGILSENASLSAYTVWSSYLRMASITGELSCVEFGSPAIATDVGIVPRSRQCFHLLAPMSYIHRKHDRCIQP